MELENTPEVPDKDEDVAAEAPAAEEAAPAESVLSGLELGSTAAASVRLKLYKGSAALVGRESPWSLYDQDLVTFEEGGTYDQRDAEGFIKLNALRLRTLAKRAARGAKK